MIPPECTDLTKIFIHIHRFASNTNKTNSYYIETFPLDKQQHYFSLQYGIKRVYGSTFRAILIL